ncbi:type I toxin-antitoxin system SymE family toxin [Pectobacterium versatile]|nr:SymE family type I addiction module toxin [Pectobacterium versatile]MCA5933498.1 type I toxin-antitoxin system SymE family toxin [Pectobacterium versatile]MCA5950594.1 type I toxin-antitoxin system SymE family toxin [Pectobacterium versatile]UCP83822.1 type I toxin-antitoxin system SymE family toxin [Pectobacterium versatile]
MFKNHSNYYFAPSAIIKYNFITCFIITESQIIRYIYIVYHNIHPYNLNLSNSLAASSEKIAGDWLTLIGLVGQPLMIEVLPGKIIIQAEMRTMLA